MARSAALVSQSQDLGSAHGRQRWLPNGGEYTVSGEDHDATTDAVSSFEDGFDDLLLSRPEGVVPEDVSQNVGGGADFRRGWASRHVSKVTGRTVFAPRH